jgi:hypothetical protein
MIVALLLALSTPAEIADWDGVPVPDEAARAYNAYFGCVTNPVLDGMESGEVQPPAERKARTDKILADCRPIRVEAVAGMDAKLAQKPGWTDPVIRRARIERIVGAMEERVGFTVRDPEGFQKRVEDLRQCMSTGRKDCEPASPTPVPAN